MTVEELIKELSKVSDKKKKVFSVGEYGEWTPLNYVLDCDVDKDPVDNDCVVLSEYGFI